MGALGGKMRDPPTQEEKYFSDLGIDSLASLYVRNRPTNRMIVGKCKLFCLSQPPTLIERSISCYLPVRLSNNSSRAISTAPTCLPNRSHVDSSGRNFLSAYIKVDVTGYGSMLCLLEWYKDSMEPASLLSLSLRLWLPVSL